MGQNSKEMDILEPLRVALKLEQEGRKFFREAAERCEGDLPRRTFEFLAAEEDKHIEHIEEFFKSLVDSEDAAPPPVNDNETENRFVDFAHRMDQLKEEIKPTASDVEAYQYAIRFENGAEEFYAEQAEKADKPHVKKFYKWLIREEERHAKLLNNCVEFAEDPARWFQRQSDQPE